MSGQGYKNTKSLLLALEIFGLYTEVEIEMNSQQITKTEDTVNLLQQIAQP